MTSKLTPKPAYLALQTMTRELAGYKIARRMNDYGTNDFVLLFSKRNAPMKIAAWTLDKPHSIRLPVKHKSGSPADIVLELGPLPKYIDAGGAQLE